MRKADAAAKAAAGLQQIMDQPPNPPAILRRIKEQLMRATRTPPPQEVLTRLLGKFNPEETYKALRKLSRPDATLVAQIRSGHCPLNSYLHRFKAVESPNCDLCKQVESVDHLLLQCRKFAGLRRELIKAAQAASTAANRTQILTNPALFPALADFGRRTFRFYKARYRRQAPRQPIRVNHAGPTRRHNPPPPSSRPTLHLTATHATPTHPRPNSNLAYTKP